MILSIGTVRVYDQYLLDEKLWTGINELPRHRFYFDVIHISSCLPRAIL